MNKILLPVLGVVAIGAGAFGVIQMNAASELRGSLDQLNARVAQLEKDRDDALDKSAKALAELEALRENNARLAKERDIAKARAKELVENAEKNAGIASEAAPGQRGDKPQFDIKNMAQGFFKSLDNPEVRTAMKSGQERMINGVYGGLFKKLGLDEQTSKLAAEIISDRNFAALDKGRKLAEAGLTEEGMAAVRKEVEGVKSEYDTKLKGVLGDQGYNEFNAFEQTVGDQRAMRGFARNLEEKGVPFQPGQQETLTNILREERLKDPSNEIPDLGGGPGMALLKSEAEIKEQQRRETDIQQRVIGQLPGKGFSPDQVSAVADSFKQQNESKTIGRAMGRAFLGGGGR